MPARLAISALLLALVAAVFSPLREHDFVNFDDRSYVVENPMLGEPLGWESLRRAFLPYETNWIPLTWISLQLNHALHGMAPAGFLLTNVALHAASALLLFLALLRMTGALWPSAAVAAVFAVHPLHVESVAWVSERKDCLSGLFFMLCLLAWARYAERPGVLRYLPVALCLALGLMAKPMLVTLPFVLLLLDRWPLQRGLSPARALLEKLPLLALAAAAAVVTYAVQRSTGAMWDHESLALGWRLANAVDATALYLLQSFWPSGLAAFYPHPMESLPTGRVALGATLLGLLSLGALYGARRRPWLALGWLWFLGMLVPVSGIVQVGLQARADRYTYLPQIGLAIAVVWSAAELARPGRARLTVAAAGAAALLALATTARLQVGTWKDTQSLFERAVQVTRDNYLAHQAVASGLLAEGRREEAEPHFREALRLRPEWPAPHRGLAEVLAARGDTPGALAQLEEALRLSPRHHLGRIRYAGLLHEAGRHQEAVHQCLRVLRTARGEPAARAQALLGSALLRTGRATEARSALEAALALGDDSAGLRLALGETERRLGRGRAAIEHYRAALQLDPDSREAANNLGWLLATHPADELRDPQAALRLVSPLLRDPGSAEAALLDTLAAGQAASGDFAAATDNAHRAAELAEGRGDAELAAEIRRRAALYAAGRAYLERP